LAQPNAMVGQANAGQTGAKLPILSSPNNESISSVESLRRQTSSPFSPITPAVDSEDMAVPDSPVVTANDVRESKQSPASVDYESDFESATSENSSSEQSDLEEESNDDRLVLGLVRFETDFMADCRVVPYQKI